MEKSIYFATVERLILPLSKQPKLIITQFQLPITRVYSKKIKIYGVSGNHDPEHLVIKMLNLIEL